MVSPQDSKDGNARHGLAARMGAWSAEHRKKAIWGWLAFVVVAVALGTAVGQNQIKDVDTFQGESGRAEKALDRSGLRPVDEVVLLRNPKLTVTDPRFRAAIGDVAGRLSHVRYVRNVESP